MADDVKRVQVRIGGITYALVSVADEQYTRQIGARADEMIRRVIQSNPQLSYNMATVLALVNAVDDLSRIYDKMKHNDNRQQENDKKVSEMHLELQRLREQNWEMKKNMLELRSLCREYENELAHLRTDQKSRAGNETELPDQAADDNTQSPEAVEAAADTAEPDNLTLAPAAQPEQQQQQEQQQEQQSPQPAAEEIGQRALVQTHFDDFLRPLEPAANAGNSDSAPQQPESSHQDDEKSDD